MNEDQLIARLPDLLRTHWQLPATSISRLDGGMNSTTALVKTDDGQWVAKWVTAASGPGFLHGAHIAARLANAGMQAGQPLPASDGDLTGIDSDAENQIGLSHARQMLRDLGVI